MRPYISLDIETTGTDRQKSEILEIGWVLDDGINRVEELVKRNFIVQRKTISYGEVFALDMNARIFKALKDKHESVVDAEYIAGLLMEDIEDCSRLALEWDKEHGLFQETKQNKKIQFAGKNFSSFDGQFMDPFMRGLGVTEYFKMVQHRALDVGPMYAEEFGYVPSLDEICARHLSGQKVNHKAVDDAMMVVNLIRNKMRLG